MPIAFWFCAVITAISATVSFGYSVAGLRGATGSARSESMYTLSRSLGLFTAAIVAVFADSLPFAAAVAVAMVIVQAGDAVVGALLRNRFTTIGPVATAVINLAALIWMLRS